jgi:16S rRNA (cytosine1402-N4)-methyltransferase
MENAPGMTTPTPCHVPVLLDEVLHWLQPSAGKTIVDGTLGGGGHAAALSARVRPGGHVIGIDLDEQTALRADAALANLPFELVLGNYCNLPEILQQLNLERVDGVVLDLGLSSDQLADPQRGFSFHSPGPLDLRFDPTRGEPAWRLLERVGEQHLANLIYQYGEERYSRRIARQIVATRRACPVRHARELADLVRRCVPRSRGHNIDPATRTFQALRIAVNRELASLEGGLARIPGCLRPGGRLAIISFHSLEDRLVKHAFRNDHRLRVMTRRPVCPTEAEQKRNPRARSAKLRVAEKVQS